MARDYEKQKAYIRAWRNARRAEWVAKHGPCTYCGSDRDLQIDHIDPRTKTIEAGLVFSRKAEIREAELAKCQVLCRVCHELKNKAETQTSCEFHRRRKRKCTCYV